MSLIAERVRKDRQSAIFADNVFQFSLNGSKNNVEDTQFEYKDTLRQLESHYIRFKKLVLGAQSLVSGLFPEYGNFDNLIYTKNEISKIRDNIYCAMASWALCQAYKRIDDNTGRIHELAQSAVKCMRGILTSWMHESEKLEKFKFEQTPRNALSSILDLKNGMEMESTKNYEHLQLDIVSLYLITLVQMIASGLQIIYTRDEVSLIQNLVFYIERAYRTPDFGMWERGTKYNNGTLELHASSIGMAKAALEIINGFNLYGAVGNYSSIVYVDIDAHNRNRTILETLLPRESNSKNSDCSLLPTLGFPCFATHDETLLDKCIDRIKTRLEGKYGFKRFIRDGYGTEYEATHFGQSINPKPADTTISSDKNPNNRDRTPPMPGSMAYQCEYKGSLYYEKGQIKDFDGIESQWPIFYIFMIINGVFKKNCADVQHYIALLEPLLKQTEDDIIVPKYYYVPEQLVEMERKYPSTQLRYSSPEYKEGRCFLWAQSLYLIANLLVEGHLHITELDPMRKFLPGSERPRNSSRYSFFQGTASDLVVQIVPISESTRLQSFLSMYGIKTQTPHQVEPIEIWPPSELLKAYSFLGANKGLNLSGRPPRPIGCLGTSKFYRVCSTTILCHPLLLEVRDFYLSYDISLLLNDIRNEILLLGKCWRISGRPTYCLFIREANIKSHRFTEMLDLLADMKKGEIDGVKVKLCRVQNCISVGCTEHLDFVSNYCDITQFSSVEELMLLSTGYSSFVDRFPLQSYPREDIDKVFISSLTGMTTWDLVKAYKNISGLQSKSLILHELWKREGLKYIFDQETIGEKMDSLIHEAGGHKLWDVVRYCSAMMGKMADSLAPSLTSLLVRGKQLSIGVFGQTEEVVDKPLMPNALKDIIYKMTMPYDVYQSVLQQEMLLYVAGIINTKPFLFHGILTIRLGWLIHAIEVELHLQTPHGTEPIKLHDLAPGTIKELLFEVLSTNKIAEDHFQLHVEGSKYQHESLLAQPLVVSPFGNAPPDSSRSASSSPERKKTSILIKSPLRRRILEGSLNRVPSDLYQRVWDILQRCPKGITVHGRHLPQQPIIGEMTRNESNFALTIERLLCQDPDPAHRQIVVELLMVISTIFERNPELSFSGAELNVDQLITEAYGYFKSEKTLKTQLAIKPSTNLEAQTSKTIDDMNDFFDLPPNTPNGTLVFLARAAINVLLGPQNMVAEYDATTTSSCSSPPITSEVSHKECTIN